jgi:uncharacterized protein (DUF433 family)
MALGAPEADSAAASPEPVPLAYDPDGNLRVSGTRVTLDSIVGAYLRGDSPEEINEQYPTVPVADVYAVLTFVLRHRAEVQRYLDEREGRAQLALARIDALTPRGSLRDLLLSRRTG